MLKQHFVTFYSPGTFTAETSIKPIEAWDTDAALALMSDIKERYGARPYGFRFSTRVREDTDLDSKEVARSPMHYVNCNVETLEEIETRNDPQERILRANMRHNGWMRVASPRTGWRWLRRRQKAVATTQLVSAGQCIERQANDRERRV